MKIHILGICGTFMGGIALLARESGIEVSGSDENVYPPMSTMLESHGISIQQGLTAAHIKQSTFADGSGTGTTEKNQVVVGNIMTRGMDVVEYMLNNRLNYTSGPHWLYENILKDRWVLAVSGTHGKTTTASILAWILEYANLKPGFLIGGIPENFGVSSRLGESPFFVVEADEYDTAFFDKRSKFVHYHPNTLIINNLEFDHADIFSNLESIKTQFHHLMRILPGNGLAIINADDRNVLDVIDRGCWTPAEKFSAHSFKESDNNSLWAVKYIESDGSEFEVFFEGESYGVVNWSLIGEHNVSNALAAISAARHAGVPVEISIRALAEFKGIKRRMELRGEVNNICVYDDFAHHPTAIATTLKGLRKRVGNKKIIAILEPRSNTMRMGVHKKEIAGSLQEADQIIMFQPEGLDWEMDSVVAELRGKATLYRRIEALVDAVCTQANSGDQLLVMSNGGFAGVHEKLLNRLKNKYAPANAN